jgi:prepilin-type N-terminal cleavage/methylation domain-containing protein
MAQWLDRSPSQPPAACRCNNVRRDERGFTLVEVLVSTVIMLVGLVAVAQLLAASVQTHKLGRLTSEASRLSTVKLEELVKSNMATSAAVQITPAGPDSLANNVPNYFDVVNGYTRRWRITAGPTPDTRRVTVNVIPPVSARPFSKTVEVMSILRQW